MLIEILGRDGVAPGSGFTGKRQVTVVAFHALAEICPLRRLPGGLGLCLWFVGDGRDQRRCGLLALRPSFIEQSLLVLVSRAPNAARVTLASDSGSSRLQGMILILDTSAPPGRPVENASSPVKEA